MAKRRIALLALLLATCSSCGCDAAATGSGTLRAQILAPAPGSKLRMGDKLGVRIQVEAGEDPELTWSLSLRQLGSGEPQTVASGTGVVQSALVAELAADRLAAGQQYVLRLTVSGASGKTMAESGFHVTDPAYTLIPLDAGNFSREIYPIGSGDAAGSLLMYSGLIADPEELILFHRHTGRFESVLVDIGSTEGVKLSGNATRLFFQGWFPRPRGAFGLGFLDLHNRAFSRIAAEGDWLYSTDATGTRVVYQGVAPDRTAQYFLFDEATGETRQLTDDPNAIIHSGGSTLCPPILATTPLITADGTTIVLITSATLGLVDPDENVGCRVFSYAVAERKWTHVASLPGSMVLDVPTLSPDGSWLSFIVSRRLPNGISRSFPAVIDLGTGELRDPIVDVGDFTSFDSVVTGDRHGVVISTQADLDPRVGNADHNMELFRYDFEHGTFAQITETTGGIGSQPGGCSSLRPYVSRDATVVLFYFARFSVEMCALDGPQRNEPDNFLFRGVRAIRKRPGNQVVEFAPPPDQSVAVGDTLSLNFTATDPDIDPITFFAQVKDGTDVPPGSEITDHHDGTATFRWPTRPEHVGMYILRVAAFDEGGGEVFHDVTINVVPQGSPSTPTVTPLPTTPPTDTCVGDCDANHQVSVGELVTGVNILLELTPVTTCPAFDCNATGTVTVSCLTQAVNAALTGCP